jgi:hypothetical protein
MHTQQYKAFSKSHIQLFLDIVLVHYHTV